METELASAMEVFEGFDVLAFSIVTLILRAKRC
jgi:hypothetical protein